MIQENPYTIRFKQQMRESLQQEMLYVRSIKLKKNGNYSDPYGTCICCEQKA